jgi:predicted Zn-dependent protease
MSGGDGGNPLKTEEMEQLEQAYAQAPEDPETACNLAMLFLEEEQDSRAMEILRPVLAAQPDHPRANLCMAMALAKLDPFLAREHAAKALRDSDPERRQQAKALLQVLRAESDAIEK